MQIIIKKKKKYFETRYSPLKIKSRQVKDDLLVSFHVENFFGKFSKGFVIRKGTDEKLVLKMFSALEKSLQYTAMYWFLSKEAPKKK